MTDLESMLSRDLADCSEEQRAFFARASVAPTKWRLSPWGDEGGGFWVVAVHGSRALWFNDIEYGFNVSEFEIRGEIPGDEYWCNQESLRWAIPMLQGEPGTRREPPEPIRDL